MQLKWLKAGGMHLITEVCHSDQFPSNRQDKFNEHFLKNE